MVSYRTPLSRARGLGAAKHGVGAWISERVAAIALVPLTLWFIFSMVRLVGAPQEAVVIWAGHPVNTVLLLALIAATFHHMQLGIQVVLEDYVDSKALMNVLILANKAVAALLGLAAAIAGLKLSLL